MNRMNQTTLARFVACIVLCLAIVALLGGCAVTTVTIYNDVTVRDSNIEVQANRLTSI